MNKLITLFAMLIGITAVSHIEAAGKDKPAKVVAKDDKAADAPATDEAEAPRKSTREWIEAHPYKTAMIAIPIVTATGLGIDYLIRRKKSWIYVKGRELLDKNAAYYQLDKMIAVKKAAADAQALAAQG